MGTRHAGLSPIKPSSTARIRGGAWWRSPCAATSIPMSWRLQGAIGPIGWPGTLQALFAKTPYAEHMASAVDAAAVPQTAVRRQAAAQAPPTLAVESAAAPVAAEELPGSSLPSASTRSTQPWKPAAANLRATPSRLAQPDHDRRLHHVATRAKLGYASSVFSAPARRSRADAGYARACPRGVRRARRRWRHRSSTTFPCQQRPHRRENDATCDRRGTFSSASLGERQVFVSPRPAGERGDWLARAVRLARARHHPPRSRRVSIRAPQRVSSVMSARPIPWLFEGSAVAASLQCADRRVHHPWLFCG